MEEPLDETHAALLEHRGWIRELARRLVRDEDAAEDLAQQTWLAALRRPPPRDRPLRRWLALVLRNFARQRHRGEESRVAAELGRARFGEAPALEEATERLAMHRQLVETLERLDEPYRSTLLLRYYQELSPRAIAELRGIPLKTVYAQLQRGLGLMRAELDRKSGGDRRQWIAGLVVCFDLGAPRSGAASSAGSVVAVMGAAAVLTLGLVAWLGRDAKPASDVRVKVAADGGATAGEIPAASESAAARTVAAVTESAPARTGDVRYFGRVVDFAGRPIPHVRVVALEGVYRGSKDATVGFVPSEPRAIVGSTEASADGSFELFTASETTACLTVDSSDWVAAVRARLHTFYCERERVLVAEPRRPLAGLVSGADGAPIARAELALELATLACADLPASLSEERAGLPLPSVRTDELGRFELADAFRLTGLSLSVTAPGFAPARLALDDELSGFAEIVLARADDFVRGRVLRADGMPAAGALVSLGDYAVESGTDGIFELPDRPRAERLVAAQRGSLPAFVEPLRDEPDGPHAWPEPLELVLGGVPLMLHGTVRSTAGEPIAGAWIWVADPTPFGRMRGAVIPGTEVPLHVEGLVSEREDKYWICFLTDARGRFAIDGLLDRDYVVRAMVRETLALGESDPVRAGSGRPVVISIATSDVFPRVAGRVLTLDGRPLVGASVVAMRDVLELPRPWHPYSFRLTYGGRLHPVGEDGAFGLPPIARGGTLVNVQGEEFDSFKVPLDPRADAGELEILVPQRARVVVEHATATHFELRDEGDLPLVLQDDANRVNPPCWRAPLVRRSLVYLVSESARTLVLWRGEELIATVPVELAAGELNLLP